MRNCGHCEPPVQWPERVKPRKFALYRLAAGFPETSAGLHHSLTVSLDTSATRCLEQEPNTTLGLIDPVLEDTSSSDVARIIAKAMHSAHAHDQSPFIFTKLTQHIRRVNVIRVIIRESLESSDVPDRPYCRSTNLPYAFGDVVGDCKNLIRVLIEEQMVVPKMGPAHVPVEVLRLQVKREYVRQQSVERS
jgi:hypothetical protein